MTRVLCFVKKDLRILMLEDQVDDANLAQYALRDAGMEFLFHRVDTKEDFLQELERHPPDMILSDYALPDFDGRTALHLTRQKLLDIPFIFVTGTMGEEAAIETLKCGATDYVLKNRLARLAPAVMRALDEAQERAERKRAEAKLRDSHAQLRSLSTYLQYVREEERTRIAREVHDELGQALTGLKLDLAWLINRLPKEYRLLHQKAQDMSGQIDTVIRTVRRIATELRPGILDGLGLAAAIEWQAGEFQNRTGIQCTVTTTVRDPVLDQDLNTVFFRVFQETLTNITRHANATRVEVTFREVASNFQLEVKDNGRGITEAEIHNAKSIGVAGMRERVALLGGDFNIRGLPGRGTTVTVRIAAGPKEKPHHENSTRR